MADSADKIRMAVKARRDPDFLIIARTDAMKTHGYDEGLRRLEAGVQAGADLLMCFPNSREEAAHLPRDVKAPVGYVNAWGNRVGRPILKVQEAQELGYAFLIDALPAVVATFKAVKVGLAQRGRRKRAFAVHGSTSS